MLCFALQCHVLDWGLVPETFLNGSFGLFGGGSVAMLISLFGDPGTRGGYVAILVFW